MPCGRAAGQAAFLLPASPANVPGGGCHRGCSHTSGLLLPKISVSRECRRLRLGFTGRLLRLLRGRHGRRRLLRRLHLGLLVLLPLLLQHRALPLRVLQVVYVSYALQYSAFLVS